MIAIWPLGPPNEIKPSFSQNRNASLKRGWPLQAKPAFGPAGFGSVFTMTREMERDYSCKANTPSRFGPKNLRISGRAAKLPVANQNLTIENRQQIGVLAQLVERLNGIEEVRGSNPLGSSLRSRRRGERRLSRRSFGVGGHLSACHNERASFDSASQLYVKVLL